MSTRVYAALNKKRSKDAFSLANELKGVQGNFGYKVNGDLLSRYGFGHVLPKIVGLKKPVFADMKMWKGKGSMSNIIKDLASFGVNYTNLYCQAKKDHIKYCAKTAEDNNIKLLGLTVLTYETDESCKEKFGKSLKDSVRYFAEVAYDAGCDGIILPPTALDVVEDMDIEKFTPGIRPVWYEDPKDAQKQKLTPGEASRKGSDDVILGGPFYKMKFCPQDFTPRLALKKVLEEVNF